MISGSNRLLRAKATNPARYTVRPPGRCTTTTAPVGPPGMRTSRRSLSFIAEGATPATSPAALTPAVGVTLACAVIVPISVAVATTLTRRIGRRRGKNPLLAGVVSY